MAITLVGLAHSRLLGRMVDNPFARYTATVSFGLYVWHYRVLYLFSYITDGKFEYYGILSWPQHLAISGAVLVVSYALATLSWRRLEQPVLRSAWATRR
jgi:peptidoglycan/LPS O-acetylase OafA/YrhL